MVAYVSDNRNIAFIDIATANTSMEDTLTMRVSDIVQVLLYEPFELVIELRWSM